MLVLLSDIILFTQVDEIHNRFSSEKEQWVDDLDLFDHMLVVATYKIHKEYNSVWVDQNVFLISGSSLHYM